VLLRALHVFGRPSCRSPLRSVWPHRVAVASEVTTTMVKRVRPTSVRDHPRSLCMNRAPKSGQVVGWVTSAARHTGADVARRVERGVSPSLLRFRYPQVRAVGRP
jgi:hypothetical protein